MEEAKKTNVLSSASQEVCFEEDRIVEKNLLYEAKETNGLSLVSQEVCFIEENEKKELKTMKIRL